MGSPDYQQNVVLFAIHQGQMVPVSVNAAGQLVSVIQGFDGVDLRTIRTNAAGEMIARITGPGGFQWDFDRTGAGMVALLGWAEGAYRKQPLIWGFSGRLAHAIDIEHAVAGTNIMETFPVPTGEVHVYTHMALWDATSATSRLLISAVQAGAPTRIGDAYALPADVTLYWDGFMVFSAADVIRGEVFGARAGDRLRFRANGYRMALGG